MASNTIVGMISHHERGLMNTNYYKERIMEGQLSRQHHYPKTINEMFMIKRFQQVRSNCNGELVGINIRSCPVFNTAKVISRIYVLKFTYDPTSQKEPVKKNTIITSLTVKKTLKECMTITDTCDVSVNGKKPILFAGNSLNEGLAGLTYFNCTGRKLLDYEWRVPSKAKCVAYCDFTQQFALGCREGYYLFNTVRMGDKRVINYEDVLDLQFSNDGNFIILCTDKEVSITDIREHECFRRYCSVKERFGSSCRKRHVVETPLNSIRNIKLLGNQTSLITQDSRGILAQADLRMMKTVFKYERQCERTFKRNICLDEDLDLICTPGGDQSIRIWSLGSGKLIYENSVYKQPFGPLVNDDPPHCCFITNQRRWFVAVIHDTVVIPIAPTDEIGPGPPGYKLIKLELPFPSNSS